MISLPGRTWFRRAAQATFLNGLSPVLFLAGSAGAPVSASAQPLTIHWRIERPSPVVEVEGISPTTLANYGSWRVTPAEWQRVFSVYAQQVTDVGQDATAMPAMTGKWSVVGQRLSFEPQFPLSRGVRYRAEFRAPGVPEVVSFFELPADRSPATTQVARVYPTADTLPENQLKFYVEFSAPMRRGGTYEHIHLRDGQGREVELPFLELDEELWDLTMTRLTLLVDPGRIKRGVKPLEDIGPVFELGKSYVLTIDANCRDAAGRPLRGSFEKKFQIAAADRTPPDPQRWKIVAPPAGTRDPLLVEFDEPMDQALALRLIGVIAEDRGGKVARLAGDSALGSEERRWTFVPQQPWGRGQHLITIQTTIEDLGGNNVGKVFDVDVFEKVDRRISAESVSVAFAVR